MNIRTLCCAGLTLVALSTSVALAQVTQEEYRARREAKLAEEWLTQANWILDYDEARSSAAADGKRILAYFTRSYAP